MLLLAGILALSVAAEPVKRFMDATAAQLGDVQTYAGTVLARRVGDERRSSAACLRRRRASCSRCSGSCWWVSCLPGRSCWRCCSGVAVPIVTDRFRVARLPVRRVDAALRLAGVFLYDLVVANIAVARAVLGSMSRIQPRFVRVPLDIDDPAATTLLAALVTLTPGTVSVDIDQSARTLTVHMLLVADEQAAVRQIKTRYEARIREIFQC